ncbi:MAG: Glycosyl transferase, family 2 [uncultured Sulfurovum sp.]|uniref:Glycosyl transferase, family 2 n=1 Tax=uncultured Sulfurovum sp. TaxID=269237 RepID=A0A6S6U9N1_9BACT|nr:MAG: Glycosyl transferase, family 2 [uncultured Sulfurovum sp.]
MKKDISVIILTLNEEKHIKRCIESLKPFVKEIFIVDSFSTDKTIEIAEALGAKVYQNKWPNNHAIQFQWGLDNCPIETEWVMKMDSDEYIEPELASEIPKRLENLEDNISGIYLKRKVFFMDKWIRWGAFYPHVLLRIWRKDDGRMEQRWMDEHIVLSKGKTILIDKADIVDHSKNSFTWWIDKHNNYATREMIDLKNMKYKFMPADNSLKENNDPQAKMKRLVKEKIYSRLPLGTRPFIYFFYRYFLRLGFLDGFRGFVWHFMQGWWYRMLVDVKCYEFERKLKNYDDIKVMIEKEYGVKV